MERALYVKRQAWLLFVVVKEERHADARDGLRLGLRKERHIKSIAVLCDEATLVIGP